jgi:hypothetical protein
MPTNVTPVNGFTAPVKVPNDGEPANNASLLALAQPLADQGTYNQYRTMGRPGGVVLQACPVICSVGWASPPLFDTWRNLNPPVDPICFILPSTPVFDANAPVYLKSVTAYMVCSGHVGSLPAVMPRLKIYQTSAGGARVLLVDVVDPSPNVALYNLPHTIVATPTPLSLPVLASRQITIDVTSEGVSGGFAGGTGVIQVVAEFTEV